MRFGPKIKFNGDKLEIFLSDLQQSRFRACVGFREKHFTELLPYMQNSDFLKLSVGRFDGKMIYRSKYCSFVVEIDSQEQHCLECGEFYHNLDYSTHTASLSMEPKVPPESNEVESEKRKRGRPKGSKNKAFGHTNNVSNDVSKDSVIISKDEIKAEYDEGYDRMQQTAKEEVNSLFKFQRYTLFHLRPTSSFCQ